METCYVTKKAESMKERNKHPGGKRESQASIDTLPFNFLLLLNTCTVTVCSSWIAGT